MTIPIFLGASPDTRSVVEAIESLMAYRLRADGFAAGRGGREVEHFDADTHPKAHAVEETALRMADGVSRTYPVAWDLAGLGSGDDPTPELVTWAALRSAIELEPSCPNPDFDRVKSWRDDLKALDASLTTRYGTKDDGGGSGMEAKFSFESLHAWPAGSERPFDISRRRLRW